jgi:hypothetical protein
MFNFEILAIVLTTFIIRVFYIAALLLQLSLKCITFLTNIGYRFSMKQIGLASMLHGILKKQPYASMTSLARYA